MQNPSVQTLTAEAKRLLAEKTGVEDDWSFSTRFRHVRAGMPTEVRDLDAGQILSGTVTQVKTNLDELLSQDVVVRGTVRGTRL